MSTSKETVFAEMAPRPVGPYSHAVRVGNLVYAAGQAGLDPATMKLVEGGVESETRQVLINLRNVLQAAGSSMKHVVKTLVFLKDMNDFPKMNAVYAEFFPENPPARSTIGVADLPVGAQVEIELVALCAE